MIRYFVNILPIANSTFWQFQLIDHLYVSSDVKIFEIIGYDRRKCIYIASLVYTSLVMSVEVFKNEKGKDCRQYTNKNLVSLMTVLL